VDPVVAGFIAGEESAIRAVHQRYGGPIRTVARSMVNDPELVAEVVQQTFVKAWRAASKFDGERELGPWLYAIARRTAIDVLRKEGRPTAGGHGPETDVAVTPLSFERTWEMFEVRRALNGLPSGEQEVVKLNHLMGLTHSEIAERLEIPVGTVKSRSNRAHRRLAVALGHLSPSANRSGSPTVKEGED